LPKKKTHFSVFRSASEEAEMTAEHEGWNNEGGQINSLAGVLVSTPGCAMPFKAVLTHDPTDHSAHNFATMREAEAFLRRNTPAPISRSTLLDRAPGEGLSPKSPKELPR
jgi:hypothetical protein